MSRRPSNNIADRAFSTSGAPHTTSRDLSRFCSVEIPGNRLEPLNELLGHSARRAIVEAQGVHERLVCVHWQLAYGESDELLGHSASGAIAEAQGVHKRLVSAHWQLACGESQDVRDEPTMTTRASLGLIHPVTGGTGHPARELQQQMRKVTHHAPMTAHKSHGASCICAKIPTQQKCVGSRWLPRESLAHRAMTHVTSFR